MRPTLLFTLIIGFVTSASAQFANLDINNIKARINADGTLFNNYGVGGPYASSFEAPKNSGKHTINAGSLWFGGLDAGGQLKLAAQTYKQGGSDYWPGPLDTTNASIDSTTSVSWNKVWKINRSTIDSCLAGSYGASLPQNILTWPGNGDTSKNNAKQLAPYYDSNNNGVYEPLSGDCPCVKGDQAIYFIFNDARVHDESNGNIIGLEVHGMAFAFDRPADTALNNTIFINYKVINRASFAVNNFRIGNFTDFDMGGYNDDYVGSDVMRGAYYGYNGDNFDQGTTGAKGYNDTLPAQAVVFLQGPNVNIGGTTDLPKTTTNPGSASGRGYGDLIIGNEQAGMSTFIGFENNYTAKGNPTLTTHYYNYMSGFWTDGTPLTYGGAAKGGSTVCNFMYPGNTDPNGYGTNGVAQSQWTEVLTVDGSPAAAPGDRRGIGAYGPFTLSPGAVNCISFAYVFAQGPPAGTNLQAVSKMQSAIDSVKSFYNVRGLYECDCNPANTTGIGRNKSLNENTGLIASLYPNPANNILYITTNDFHKAVQLQVYDITGQVVLSETFSGNNHSINVSGLAAGVYIINLESDSKTERVKFLIK